MNALPCAAGGSVARGLIRCEADDFVVEERLGFEPDGAGEHVLMLVEKRAANTHWVARQLAQYAGVARVDVGYAGSKDRYAVARQWFSVRLGGRADPDWDALGVEGVQVLAAARHRRKLKHGAHTGNAFRLRVRAVVGDMAKLEERLQAVRQAGVPNYYGPQRYGRDNLRNAEEFFAGARLPRVQRSFALSAARSHLFDAVLAARVVDGSWNRLRIGDAANLAGSASWFVVDRVDAVLEERVQRLDVHPTGPLWGRGDVATTGAVRTFECAVAAEHGAFARGLEAAGLEQARRALRAVPGGLSWEIGVGEVSLAFTLPPGAYATSVLRELIEVEDKGGSGAADHETC